MEKFNRIVCFGEVLWDMLPSGKKPGGALLNVAIHLKKQGANPVLISKIGNDENGENLVQFLKDSGVDQSFLQKDNTLNTSTVIVHLDAGKNATYEICEPVAWDNIVITEEIEKEAAKADLFIFGSLASRNKTTRETLFHLLQKTTATRLLDVNLRPPYSQKVIEKLLHGADVVKLNDEELLVIAGWNKVTGTEKKLIEHISEFYRCSMVCVTRGAKGAILFTGNEYFEHPGFKVIAKDTVGAGDSFLASLVASFSKNLPSAKALEYACATGSYIATQKGAVPNYSEKEIIQIINLNKI